MFAPRPISLVKAIKRATWTHQCPNLNQYLQRYVVLLFPEINICHVTQYTLTHHFVRRLIGFVVCCDTVKQQKHHRQRQQGHHRDFMCNEGHFLVLRELAEKEKV